MSTGNYTWISASPRKEQPTGNQWPGCLTLIWSYSWIFVKQVTSYIGAFDFTALRCIFGAPFFHRLLHGRGMRPTPFIYNHCPVNRDGRPGTWALVSGGREGGNLSYPCRSGW